MWTGLTAVERTTELEGSVDLAIWQMVAFVRMIEDRFRHVSHHGRQVKDGDCAVAMPEPSHIPDVCRYRE